MNYNTIHILQYKHKLSGGRAKPRMVQALGQISLVGPLSHLGGGGGGGYGTSAKAGHGSAIAMKLGTWDQTDAMRPR